MRSAIGGATLALVLIAAAPPAAAQKGAEVPPAAAPHFDGFTIPVSFTKLAARIPAGTPWAKLQYNDFPLPCSTDKVLTWDSKANEIFEDPELERVFREEYARAGGTVSGDPTNLFEQDKKSSDLQVGALITKIDGAFCSKKIPLQGNRPLYSGAVTMDVEWQVYSTVQAKIVARLPVTGRYTTRENLDGEIIILHRAFADAVRGLLGNETFRTAVQPPTVTAPTPPAPTTALAIRYGPGAGVTPAQASGAVAVVFAGSSMGSAFLISPDGYLLTNHHVVGDATRVRIRWADKSETAGEVIRSDRRRDVALIRADSHGRTPLGLRGGAVQPGEAVFAIGTPLDKDLQSTVTRGIVSASRVLDGKSFIQSDVAVDHGNSGGPLLDDKGRVIGITEWGYAPDGVSHNLNFFIPIDDALRALALSPAS